MPDRHQEPERDERGRQIPPNGPSPERPTAGPGVTQEAADSATQPDVDDTNEG